MELRFYSKMLGQLIKTTTTEAIQPQNVYFDLEKPQLGERENWTVKSIANWIRIIGVPFFLI